MKRSEMITKKDFVIKCEFTGSQLRGQENQVHYVIYKKGTGLRIGWKHRFYTKRSAEAWLGRQIKLANEIKAGKIVVERDENGKIIGGYRVKDGVENESGT